MKKYLLIQISNIVSIGFRHSLKPLVLASIFIAFASVATKAQTDNNITLSGHVVEEKTKTPLEGATVHIKGTTHEVLTNKAGEFKFITGQKIPVVYIVSFVGYQTQELPVNEASGVQIALKEASSQLNDVVVVGYGTQTKKSLIGSVASVKASEINNKPAASFDQQLQGRVAGVQVSANTGVPGDGIFFRIRGTTSINASNDPLYVVDGVFVNNQSLQKITTQGQANNPLADINPADIESISILKDATATAIYGARAANGVVLITTKRGTYNSRPKVSFNAYLGSAWAPKLWDLVTGPEHATIINEAWVNDGKPYDTRPFRPKSEGGGACPKNSPPMIVCTTYSVLAIYRTMICLFQVVITRQSTIWVQALINSRQRSGQTIIKEPALN